MGRIGHTFKRLREKGEKALISYVMAGDPSLARTKRLVLDLEEAGTDLIELGVPFSDPVADGPTIQRAAVRALKKGVTLQKVIDLVSGVRSRVSAPVILMTYFNPIVKMGEQTFTEKAVAAGVDGVIIPDLIPDEGAAFLRMARKAGLDTVCLLAPTSTPDRVRKVARASTGFIYYVSITGITGSGLRVDSDIAHRIQKVSSEYRKPVCVGFGVSKQEEARKMAQISDGVIVGSAIVRMVEEGKDIRPFIRALKKAVTTSGKGRTGVRAG